MRKFPVKHEPTAVRDIEGEQVEVVEPERRRGPFVSFSYTCTEISALGGKARVRARSARFEDGKLTSEAFDGELDRGAYERAVGEMQRQFANQMTLLMKPFAALLLQFGSRRPPDRD